MHDAAETLTIDIAEGHDLSRLVRSLTSLDTMSVERAQEFAARLRAELRAAEMAAKDARVPSPRLREHLVTRTGPNRAERRARSRARGRGVTRG